METKINFINLFTFRSSMDKECCLTLEKKFAQMKDRRFKRLFYIISKGFFQFENLGNP